MTNFAPRVHKRTDELRDLMKGKQNGCRLLLKKTLYRNQESNNRRDKHTLQETGII